MKKLIPTLLFAASAFGFAPVGKMLFKSSLVDYEPAHKDAIVEIAFQSPELFFGGSEMLKKLPRSAANKICEENKQGLLDVCDNPKRQKKLLVDADNKVVGFVVYFKTRQHSLESAKAAIEKQREQSSFLLRWFIKIPTDEQILATNPNIKRTDAECEQYALIEGIAVSKDHRGQGCGKHLIQEAIKDIKQNSPEVTLVKLNVNKSNAAARALYEKEGFVESKVQATAMNVMGVVEYEKQI